MKVAASAPRAIVPLRMIEDEAARDHRIGGLIRAVETLSASLAREPSLSLDLIDRLERAFYDIHVANLQRLATIETRSRRWTS